MKRLWLAAEYSAVFVLLPLAYRYDLVPLPVFPALWLIAAICLLVLRADPGFDRRRLWNPVGARELYRLALPFVLAAPLLATFMALYDPERLFGFVRARPLVWAAVMLLYPVLSVYPQGLVYRVFVFHRYRPLFPARWAMVLASAFAFGLIHVIFRNWLAPPLSFLGGLMFAWTYERTQSSLAATMQHALFGCYLFTLGLGWYFYYGARAG